MIIDSADEDDLDVYDGSVSRNAARRLAFDAEADSDRTTAMRRDRPGGATGPTVNLSTLRVVIR